MWQMLLPWWPDGIATGVNLVLIQMLYVGPHPIYEADGTKENKNLYMVVPYHKDLVRESKDHATNLGFRCSSKEVKQ